MTYITSVERLGIEKGREEVREEAKHEIAKRLLAKNESVMEVAEVTGLLLEKIKELREELH